MGTQLVFQPLQLNAVVFAVVTGCWNDKAGKFVGRRLCVLLACEHE